MPAVRIERTVAATPARVFRAWLQPDLMVRWFAPPGYRAVRAEADPRVGGRVLVWHRDDERDVGGVVAEIAELVPDERIVLRFWFGSPDEPVDPLLESRLTLTFAPADPGGTATLLTLVHDRLDGLTAAHPEITDGVRPGWTGALDTLTTELEN